MSLLEQFQNLSPSEWKKMKPGLDRMRSACEALGRPETRFPSIHIAGTNGKGSVAAMLHSIFTEAGFKAGLFTSPHLVRVNERFRVGNEEISDGELESLLKQIQESLNLRSPLGRDLTFFELCTLIAFLHFAHEKVDLAILETGLGGRLDATSVVQPLLSIITEISLDHTEILGKDLASIAREKAGIIKPKTPVLCGAALNDASSVIREVAKENGAPFIVPSPLPPFSLGLPGAHQHRNASLAYTAVQILRGEIPGLSPASAKPFDKVSEGAVEQGLVKVRWPGRLEWVSESPPVLLDGAHNPEGIRALVVYLREQEGIRWKVLFSAARDKDVETMLDFLKGTAQEIILCRMENERSIDPGGKKAGGIFPKISRASEGAAVTYKKVLQGLQPGEGLVVTGSLYLVGEIKRFLNASCRRTSSVDWRC